MYHGTKAGNMVACAADPLLLNWRKIAGNPVIPLTNPDGSLPPYRVFDPCIWRKGDAWYALSSGAFPDGPGGSNLRSNGLFRSRDLQHEHREADAGLGSDHDAAAALDH